MNSYYPNMQMPYQQPGMLPGQQLGMGPYQSPAMMNEGDMVNYWKDFCKKHKHYMVNLETVDGHRVDGIIDDIENDHVVMLVPIGDMERNEENELGDERQFGIFGGFGYPYGGWGYGYYPRRFRRFRRYRYPFYGLRSLFFPFFF